MIKRAKMFGFDLSFLDEIHDPGQKGHGKDPIPDKDCAHVDHQPEISD